MAVTSQSTAVIPADAGIQYPMSQMIGVRLAPIAILSIRDTARRRYDAEFGGLEVAEIRPSPTKLCPFFPARLSSAHPLVIARSQRTTGGERSGHPGRRMPDRDETGVDGRWRLRSTPGSSVTGGEGGCCKSRQQTRPSRQWQDRGCPRIRPTRAERGIPASPWFEDPIALARPCLTNCGLPAPGWSLANAAACGDAG